MAQRHLEIGSGPKRLDGFETLDIVGGPNVDYIYDASQPLPFDDGTFDLIYASHILEHIPWYKTEDTLREWARILKAGGALEVWVPDGFKIWQTFMDAMLNNRDRIAEDGFYRFNPDKDPHLWLNGRIFTYGDGTGQLNHPNWHRALFTPGSLTQLFESAGLTAVREMDRSEVRGYDHGFINLGVRGVKPRYRAVSYKTFEDLNRDIKALALRLPSDLDLIVGIPRSGLLAANLLALYFNLPITDVAGLCEGRVLGTGQRYNSGMPCNLADIKKVLVIDDSISTGASMEKVKTIIRQAGLPYQFCYAAVYTTFAVRGMVDFWSQIIDNPRRFEWNVLTTSSLEQTCVDLDGVICRDPLEVENDDGKNYRHFIANAELLVRPSYEIGWIVTCRLEKYRDLTEEWLKQHGIRYHNLVMMGLPDKATRVASKAYASFKAEVYKSSKASLFIESSPIIAQEIAALSGKNVLCLNGTLIAANRNPKIGKLLREFSNSLSERATRIQKLEQSIRQIQDSIPMQMMRRYQRIAGRLFPSGTWRHHCYELGLVAVRILLSEGCTAFARRAIAWLKVRLVPWSNSGK